MCAKRGCGERAPLSGVAPVASVVLRKLDDPPDLFAYCEPRLARYKIPVRFEFVKELPKTYKRQAEKRVTEALCGRNAPEGRSNSPKKRRAMQFDLKGGSSGGHRAPLGIGRALALAFANEGARVVAGHLHSREAATGLAGRLPALPGECLAVQADSRRRKRWHGSTGDRADLRPCDVDQQCGRSATNQLLLR